MVGLLGHCIMSKTMMANAAVFAPCQELPSILELVLIPVSENMHVQSLVQIKELLWILEVYFSSSALLLHQKTVLTENSS